MRTRPLAAFLLFLAPFLCHEASAGPTLLFDSADGRVLYAEDADDEWHPASITKIMTAYLTFEALRDGKLTIKQKLPVSAAAAAQPPSKLGAGPGANILVDSALKALIIKSANDVAIVLAEAISGSEQTFVAKMNETARRLGMTRTTFVNPNGLPAPAQVTTARDLARLARAVLKDFPEYASYWSMYDAHIGKIRIATHNGLLSSFEGADGIKTGFICDSGFNIIASATRDGRKLIAVVLGEQTGAARTIRAATLLDHGFEQYGWKSLFQASTTIDTMPVAPDAKKIVSMRTSVVSFACGTGRRAIAGRKARKKTAKGKEANPPAPGQQQTKKALPSGGGGAAQNVPPLAVKPPKSVEASASPGPEVVKPVIKQRQAPQGEAAFAP